MSMAKFREKIRATKASAAYGVNAFKDAQKTLLENGVLAKTLEKVLFKHTHAYNI